MSEVKNIQINKIDSKSANEFVKRHHYSGKVVNNSQLHFGAFLNGQLHGVLSFGPSLDKRKIQSLVEDTGWNQFVELNRMAFDDTLPKNSESRCIAIALRLIKKHAPHVKWVVSFADGTQCGDGTIYRATGFFLTGITKGSMIELPPDLARINGGKYAHRMTLQSKSNVMYKVMQSRLNLNGGYKTMAWYAEKLGTKVLEGYQLRYIYFLDKSYIPKIKVPIIPYGEIANIGAKMYKGVRLQ
jgi:hypothetical protein